jgi:Fic family protein
MPLDMQSRAGRYIRQPTGYRAFVPQDLPPDPPIQMDEELWMLLSAADRAIGRLDGSTENLPDPDLFVYMYVHKEAVLSSQIEGTQASLIDVLEYEVQASDPAAPQDIPEVVNYISAMGYGLDRLKTLPVSLRLLREIHEVLMREVRGGEKSPGEFRRSQNWIGPQNGGMSHARFVPPPPHEMNLALSNLERFLHDDRPMPTLVKVGIAHAQFETIHPFLDGNGRTGRLLITFLLCERDVLRRPLLYLSHYFKHYRLEYYEHLQAVRDAGDWEGWLKFYLRGLSTVANEATEVARKIVTVREYHRELVRDHFKGRAANALLLLERLYQRPIVTVNWVQQSTGLTFANANTLVRDFTDLDILSEITGQRRNRRFAYEAYLQLFLDADDEMPRAEPAAENDAGGVTH